MSDLSANIRLRPTRIALLVRPSDVSSIRKFMRLCACLWGGACNPIIPVFRTRPREWRDDFPESMTGAQVARGYVEFFEPDVFVEAAPGLLEGIGLGALGDTVSFPECVVALDALSACPPYQEWTEFALGLGIVDALEHVYESEQRFQLRDEKPAVLVKPNRGTGLVEAMFGLYPDDEASRHFAQAYGKVFRPEVVEATPATWIRVFNDAAVTPLVITSHQLQRETLGRDRPKFFVFDPAKATDLIDLWNLRIEANPVLPVPIDWWRDLAPHVSARITAEYRHLPGRLRDLMRSTIIQFARSIDEVRRQDCIDGLDANLPQDSFFSETRRTPVWQPHSGDHASGPRRLRLVVKERTLTLAVKDGRSPTVEFPVLAPDFASLHHDGYARWVNVVKLSSSGRDSIATLLPPNVTNAAWPRLDFFSERVVVGTEGWSFAQRYKDSTQVIVLPAQEEAVIESLKQFGVEASLSEAGHIGKQVLQHLRGLQGIQLLADPNTLKLLNRMAGGMRVRKQGEDEAHEVEEVFDRRAVSEKEWRGHIKHRLAQQPVQVLELPHFTERNVIRLGVSTKCPRCTVANWHSLTAVDYVVVCERCLEQYSFPQGALQRRNGNWSFRVIGPFSVPDYARGSYGALLALKTIRNAGTLFGRMTFSTALDLKLGDGAPCEVDYAAWVPHRHTGDTDVPRLVFGEAKSFGKGDLVRPHDLAQLRRVAKRFPGAVIAISVLREEFTKEEIRTLRPFIKWARIPDRHLVPRNPVILLTGVELFGKLSLRATWKDCGDRYARFVEHGWTSDLDSLARATQEIHLDLPTSDLD